MLRYQKDLLHRSNRMWKICFTIFEINHNTFFPSLQCLHFQIKSVCMYIGLARSDGWTEDYRHSFFFFLRDFLHRTPNHLSVPTWIKKINSGSLYRHLAGCFHVDMKIFKRSYPSECHVIYDTTSTEFVGERMVLIGNIYFRKENYFLLITRHF